MKWHHKKYVNIGRLTWNEGQCQRSKVNVKCQGQRPKVKVKGKIKTQFKIPYYYYFAKIFDFSKVYWSPRFVTLRKSERLFVKYIGHRGLSVCLCVCFSVFKRCTGHNTDPIVLIDYQDISVLYNFQSDISTNSWEIKYQNIEKSASLIIGRLVSMATKKYLFDQFEKKKILQCPGTRIHRLSRNQDDWISIVACTSFEDRKTNTQTDRQTAVTNILYEKSFRLSQSNNNRVF